MKPSQISRPDILLDLVQEGEVPLGAKSENNSTDLTYSTKVMRYKALRLMGGVGYVELGSCRFLVLVGYSPGTGRAG